MHSLFAAVEIKSGVVFFGASALVACGVLYIIFRKPKGREHNTESGDLEL
jgi:hypothetical protein